MDPDRKAAHQRFLNLRNSGYRGPIDQDGYKVKDVDAWIEAHRPRNPLWDNTKRKER